MTKQTYGALCALAEQHGVVMTEEVRAFVRAVEQANAETRRLSMPDFEEWFHGQVIADRLYPSDEDAARLAWMTAKADQRSVSAIRTLESMRYTYHGAELWKPPLGKPTVWVDEKTAAQESRDKASCTADKGSSHYSALFALCSSLRLAGAKLPARLILQSYEDGIRFSVALANQLGCCTPPPVPIKGCGGEQMLGFFIAGIDVQFPAAKSSPERCDDVVVE